MSCVLTCGAAGADSVGRNTYRKAAQNGQLPLITPDSDWVAPTELPDLRGRKLIAIDSETKDDGLAAGSGAGWAFGQGHIAGVCLAATGYRGYIPIRHPDTPECFASATVGRWYKDHIAAGVRFVMHKAIYDCGWFRAEWDAAPPDLLDDTMIMQYELDENRLEYSLDSVCRDLSIPGKDEHLLREAAATILGAETESQIKSSLHLLPARYVGPYGEQDAAATLRAYELLSPRIMEEDLTDAYQLEMDLLPLILEMRRRGIRIDEEYADSLRGEFRVKKEAALKELGQHIGLRRAVTVKEINSNSWKRDQFDREKIKYPFTAGTAKSPPAASFESDWMEKVDHWLPRLVVAASKYEAAGEKFIGNYIQGYTHRGRVHAEIHQTKGEDGGTSTTRMAYSDPPLQQMPSRDPDIGPALRRCFLPEAGEVWAAPDFSQQEFRLITHFAYLCKVAGADEPVKIYRDDPNADFHDIVVQLTGLIRNEAKDTNFAKAYRAGVPKFASMIGRSEEEARAIYAQYDEKMPFVSRLAEFCDGRAQKNGYLKLIAIGNGSGARAHFDKWEAKWVSKEERARGYREHWKMDPCSKEEALSRTRMKGHPWFGGRVKRAFTYKAMNKLIQGSAAQQTKIAMRNMWREKIVPLIQMHDEFGISCGEERKGQRAAEIMRDAVRLVVPVKVDLEYGRSFGEAKVLKDPRTKAVTYGATWDEAWAAVQARAAA